MGTTTDFKSWLDFVELENYNDIYCIYRSVQGIDEWGAFKCTEKKTTKGELYFLKCDYCDDYLILTEKSRGAFLTVIEKEYVKSDMDIEGWYYFNHSMSKND